MIYKEMGKKGVIVAVVLLALMLAGIAFGVSRLYAPGAGTSAPKSGGSHPELAAVPSDAVAVFCFDGSSKGARIAADTTGLLHTVIAPEGRFMDYVLFAARERTAVSLHNSGALVPLAVTRLSRVDSLSVARFTEKASACGLHSLSYEGFFIASSSETLVGSARRHLDTGMSILSSEGLKDVAQATDAPACVFLSNKQAPKLLQVYGSAWARSRADFVKNLSSWTAFGIREASPDRIQLQGCAAVTGQSSSFFRATGSLLSTGNQYAEALPYFTSFALSVPVDDLDAWLDAYADYMDGRGQGKAYKERISTKGKGRDKSPREWARELQVREVVKASFDVDGTSRDIVLLRCGKPLKGESEAGNRYRGYIPALFGEAFRVEDTLVAVSGKWLVTGPVDAVRSYAAPGFLDYPLSRRMSDSGVRPGEGFVVYASLTDDPEVSAAVAGASLSKAVSDYVYGTAYAPLVLSITPSGTAPGIDLSLERKASKGDNIRMQDRDTTVVVPVGPWPVTNSSTGQMNSFYQNDHLSLCLNDEKGKGVWGVPFKKRIAGYVQEVDYYANGKIQFLFAAGDQLYLIDRLGRFVGGFPVSLGKDVLLGPQAYDFTGAHGYTAMVLHTDNTLELYNLHGQKPEAWQGIRAPETVKSLPELVTSGGVRYWAVRTSIRTLLYGFNGGETLTPEEGGKMIRPDSQLEPTSKGFTVSCYDGKTRDIKLK